MSLLLSFLLLLLNFGISCWNAYIAGVIWRQVSGLMKLVAVCALIMASCGFLSVTAVVFGYVAVTAHWIDPRGFQALLGLTYLLIVVPILGSGLVITIHSWIVAYRSRDWLSIGTAGYNTVAQIHNMYSAARDVPEIWEAVSSFFTPSSDEKPEAALARVAVLLVLLAAAVAAGGLTFVFFAMGRRNALPSPAQMVRSAERLNYGRS